MAATGADIARMLLSSAAIQADLRVQDSRFRRQLHEISQQQALEVIQRNLEREREKKAAEKASRKKLITLAAVAAAAFVTGGASLAAAPGALAGAAGTAGTATASGFLAGTGTGILGTGGAAAQASLVSAFGPSTVGGITSLGANAFITGPGTPGGFGFDYGAGFRSGLNAFGVYNQER